MRALDIPFAERLVRFGEDSNWSRFREFSPTGRVPCLHDGATVVWDSLAIAEYLAERHAGIWPADPVARVWARCAAAEMHSGFSAIRNRCSMTCGQRVNLREVSAELTADVSRIGELWAEGLTRFEGPWLAGSAFTAVDAFYGPVAFRAQTYGLELGGPAASYCANLLAHPAMKEWYAAAIAEPWREPAHEREIASVGAVTADYRAPANS
jgi:glutathione S-transferase